MTPLSLECWATACTCAAILPKGSMYNVNINVPSTEPWLTSVYWRLPDYMKKLQYLLSPLILGWVIPLVFLNYLALSSPVFVVLLFVIINISLSMDSLFSAKKCLDFVFDLGNIKAHFEFSSCLLRPAFGSVNNLPVYTSYNTYWHKYIHTLISVSESSTVSQQSYDTLWASTLATVGRKNSRSTGRHLC